MAVRTSRLAWLVAEIVNHEIAVRPIIAATVATRTAADQPVSRRKWGRRKGWWDAVPLGSAVACGSTPTAATVKYVTFNLSIDHLYLTQATQTMGEVVPL